MEERLKHLLEERLFPSREECDWIIKNIRDKEEKRILDVGCGKFHSFYISNNLENCKIIGIDADDLIIKSNNEFLKKEKTMNLSFKLGNILKIKFKNDFDFIISSRLIHYISNKNKLFEKYSRLLKKGDILIMTEFLEVKKNYLRVLSSLWGRKYYPSLQKLLKIAKKNGFKEVKKTPFKCHCGNEYQIFGLMFEKQ